MSYTKKMLALGTVATLSLLTFHGAQAMETRVETNPQTNVTTIERQSADNDIIMKNKVIMSELRPSAGDGSYTQLSDILVQAEQENNNMPMSAQPESADAINQLEDAVEADTDMMVSDDAPVVKEMQVQDELGTDDNGQIIPSVRQGEMEYEIDAE